MVFIRPCSHNKSWHYLICAVIGWQDCDSFLTCHYTEPCCSQMASKPTISPCLDVQQAPYSINTRGQEQNGCHFADGIFKLCLLNENYTFIQISTGRWLILLTREQWWKALILALFSLWISFSTKIKLSVTGVAMTLGWCHSIGLSKI